MGFNYSHSIKCLVLCILALYTSLISSCLYLCFIYVVAYFTSYLLLCCILLQLSLCFFKVKCAILKVIETIYIGVPN